MSAGSWLIWLAASAAGGAFAWGVYGRRETPGRGRNVLAAMRTGAIALLLLLAFDPGLPLDVRGGRDRATVVDASLSMRLPGGAGTRWEEAVERARTAGPADVTLFGSEARTVVVDSLASLVPSGTHSRLLPALQALAEAGRRHATVLTDGAIEDADEVARWLPRLGMDVSIETLSGNAADRGLTRVKAPSYAAAGDTIVIDVDLSAAGAASGPVAVVARDGTGELARTIVETPVPGRVSTATLAFAVGAAPPGGYARFEVAIDAADAISDDDVRTIYVNVTDEPAGVVLISFRPDWEPRFLEPVLERSLGVPVRGYLRAGTEWLTLGSGTRVGTRVPDADLRRQVGGAEMLVLHGFGADSPEWAVDAALQATRLLVLPAGDGVVPGVPLPAMTAVPGDWYVLSEIPASPVAGLFAGISVSDVPPLEALHTPDRGPATWAPIVASRGRRGAAMPVALGGTTDGRRWVVALGEGYWRWAFWSTDARDVYERLWSALGSWVLGDAVASGTDAIAPVRRVVERGTQPAWLGFGFDTDSMRVRLADEQGTIVTDTVLVNAAGDTARSRVLEPGRYTWDVSAWHGDEVAAGNGEITVERFSAEFTRPAVRPASMEAAPDALNVAGGAHTPLHATIWPWLVLVGLLSFEWVLRRRWGLR